MTKPEKRKKSPIALFLWAFVVIALIMFIANYRRILKQELQSPRGGVEKLSTYQGQLIAISPNREIYVWDWRDLSARPQVSFINAQKAVAMNSGRLLWVPSGTDKELVISNIEGAKELKRLFLGPDSGCLGLQASSNGRYAVAALMVGGSAKRIQLDIIDPELGFIRPVETKTLEDGLKLNDIAISNDGSFVAAVGGSNNGWLLVVGGDNKRGQWEHYIADCNELNEVCFSPDGKAIYASESGRRVYIFDVANRGLVKQLQMKRYKTPANYPQSISCIAVSPDGRLLAAASLPKSKLWVWDAESGEKIAAIETGFFSTSSISFSPDSSLLAGADLTDRPIKVWRIIKSP